MAKRLKAWTFLALISAFLFSCVSTIGCYGCVTQAPTVKSPWSLKPQESFGMVAVKIVMKPKKCSNPSKPKKKCNHKKLPTKEVTSVGSSIVVAKNVNESKTYVLTAAHVCTTPPEDNAKYMQPEKNITLDVVLAQTVTKITILDYSGESRVATVFRVDAPNDLCLLITEGLWGKPFKVSPVDPQIGEKFYNVAAPHKIWSPGMVLMMDGYYSGRSVSGFHHYTIPARPGSSGSPILSERGLIVGMVQRAVSNFENLAISTSTQAIREILSTIPKDRPDPNVLQQRQEFFNPYL